MSMRNANLQLPTRIYAEDQTVVHFVPADDVPPSAPGNGHRIRVGWGLKLNNAGMRAKPWPRLPSWFAPASPTNW